MATNTKITNTKKSLLDAFCRLSQKCSLDDITVSALCREAGINRTTFYKYYSIPSDVLVEAVQNMIADTLIFPEENGLSLYDYMLHFCNVVYENKRFVSLYFRACGDLMPLIYQSIQASAKDISFLQKPENNFLAGGVGGLAMYWLRRDFRDSPEAIAELLAGYVKRFQD